MTIVPAFTTLGTLNDHEQRMFDRLITKLQAHQDANRLKSAYYEGTQVIRHMGMAVPRELAARIRPVTGLAGTVVDILEERLDWLGWSGGDDLGLDTVYDDNELDVEASLTHLDALIYGTSFVRVGTRSEGDPSPLITNHSPLATTGLQQPATRLLQAALTITTDWDAREVATLDLPGVTITLHRPQYGSWVLFDRDEHGLDELPVVQFVNQPRGSRTSGWSEINASIRYLCDASVRTFLGMEANREFYSIPLIALLGRGRDAFIDPATGMPTAAWRVMAGGIMAMDKDESGDNPELKHIPASSPEPFLKQLHEYISALAAEAGMPVSYLGRDFGNPTSADAIRAGEARLVRRSERRQTGFGRGWRQVGRLALLIRDGRVPDEFAQVACRWRDAATPTRAAAADEVSKYVGAGILPPMSQIVWDRMGLSPAEQNQLRKELDDAPPVDTVQLARDFVRQTSTTPEITAG